MLIQSNQKVQINQNDFEIDLVYHSNSNRNIHYSAYIPSNIDRLDDINMYITLPGWEGLYFQGVGTNLQEDFAYIAKELNKNMIILALQLDDWQEQSASETIELTEYYKEKYNVRNIYINGYSGGGETLSLVLNKRADLYDRALLVSSKWNGNIDNVVEQKIPLYFYIGENDSYYGSGSFIDTYNKIYEQYKKEGMNQEDIDKILVLD
jgi:predicted peptidase